MKRFVDVVVGGTIALGVLPLVAGLALVGACIWRANPFFVQERIGRDGRRFRLFKLRSLPPTSPPYADKYELAGLRVHPYGRWLRRTHLDELPQLVHVVTGRMSLVGPRPEMPFLHERMPQPFARERTQVRPGITGLWQISEAVKGLIAEAPEYDRAYLRSRTVRLDVWVVWRTLTKLFGVPPIAAPRMPAWTRPVSLPRLQVRPGGRLAPAAHDVVIDLTERRERIIQLAEMPAAQLAEAAGMTPDVGSSTLLEGSANG